MEETATEPTQSTATDKCTRCLQPVPYRASRCPACGQPHHNRRSVPLLIGAAGVFALAFVMGLMYYATWRADLMKADVPVDEDGVKQEIMVQPPSEDSAPKEPEKPEKPPPLNDK
jgi:hypothetical protein